LVLHELFKLILQVILRVLLQLLQAIQAQLYSWIDYVLKPDLPKE